MPTVKPKTNNCPFPCAILYNVRYYFISTIIHLKKFTTVYTRILMSPIKLSLFQYCSIGYFARCHKFLQTLTSKFYTDRHQKELPRKFIRKSQYLNAKISYFYFCSNVYVNQILRNTCWRKGNQNFPNTPLWRILRSFGAFSIFRMYPIPVSGVCGY